MPVRSFVFRSFSRSFSRVLVCLFARLFVRFFLRSLVLSYVRTSIVSFAHTVVRLLPVRSFAGLFFMSLSCDNSAQQMYEWAFVLKSLTTTVAQIPKDSR